MNLTPAASLGGKTAQAMFGFVHNSLASCTCIDCDFVKFADCFVSFPTKATCREPQEQIKEAEKRSLPGRRRLHSTTYCPMDAQLGDVLSLPGRCLPCHKSTTGPSPSRYETRLPRTVTW